MPKRCIVRMHRLDSRERVPACSSPKIPPKTHACRSRTSPAHRERVPRYSARIGGPLRVFFSAVYALSAPRTCTSRRPSSSRSLYATDCSTLERLVIPPAARSTKTTASSPLNPPIDETLVCCSKRAQDGWDAPYLIDESQVARLTLFEMQPAEWRHGAKLRKWKKDMESASPRRRARPSPSRCTPWPARTVTSPTSRALSTSHSTLFFPTSSPISAVIITGKALSGANDVQPQQYALGMRRPTETSKPAHALVFTHTGVERTKNGLYQETAVLDEDMLATTALCDRRARTILDFGTTPQTSIALSMLDRLVVIPGAGTYTVLDRVVLGVERNLLDSVCDATAVERSAITIDRGGLPHPSDRGASVVRLTTSQLHAFEELETGVKRGKRLEAKLLSRLVAPVW
ncbi:hypothetical protein GGG16DRAFT_114021 [Schizophyllum commune]